MSEFQFLRPLFLLLFIPFIVLLLLSLRRTAHSSIWNKACAKDLQPYILTKSKSRFRFLNLMLFATGSLLITALAGPSWDLIAVPLLKSQSGLVIALDLSQEMDAQDVKPSRLQRAIYKIADLLKSRKEGQTALIVFSADPFIVTPLTDDVASINALFQLWIPQLCPQMAIRQIRLLHRLLISLNRQESLTVPFCS